MLHRRTGQRGETTTNGCIPYRASRSAFAFNDTLATGIQAIHRRLGTTRLAGQSVPTVDLDFEDTLTLEVGGRRMELISVPGGETNDSLVVWLPEERICLCGNISARCSGTFPTSSPCAGTGTGMP